jgi:hypothetical protein
MTGVRKKSRATKLRIYYARKKAGGVDGHRGQADLSTLTTKPSRFVGDSRQLVRKSKESKVKVEYKQKQHIIKKKRSEQHPPAKLISRFSSGHVGRQPKHACITTHYSGQQARAALTNRTFLWLDHPNRSEKSAQKADLALLDRRNRGVELVCEADNAGALAKQLKWSI